MQTRNDTVLWPFSRCLATHFVFNGTKPPTTQDVLIMFRSIHAENQITTNRHSSLKDAAKSVVKHAQDWWIQAGYLCKPEQKLVNEILEADKTWKALSQDNNKINRKTKKITPAIEKKQNDFLNLSNKTFRVVSKGYENYLETSVTLTKDITARRKFEEDLSFLRNMHNNEGPERVGCIGGVDRHLAVSAKRTVERRKRAREEIYSGACRSLRFSSLTPSCSSSGVETETVCIDSVSVCSDRTSVCSSWSESLDSNESLYLCPKKKKPKTRGVLNLTVDKNSLEKACLSADVCGISIRHQLKYTADFIQASGGDIDEIDLSKSLLQKMKKQVRVGKLDEINKENTLKLQDENYIWILHWDGKTLKKKTHSGKKKPVLAIVLKCLNTDQEVLLDVVDMTSQSGSDAESKKVIEALNAVDFDVDRLLGVVFDTTAVNSGLRTGVTVQLQKFLGHSVLQLACRHHILELVCGAASSVVYGTTESPNEIIFQHFADIWETIDVSNYEPFTTHNRKLYGLKDTVLEFLHDWMEYGEKIREDYLQLVELAIVFLGGTFKTSYNFTFKEPGAFHHARWMGKVIYTVKLALFRNQISKDKVFNERCDMNAVYSLASFLCLFYVKYWCKSPNLVDAAVNDLELWNELNTINQLASKQTQNFPCMYKEISEAASLKFSRHVLWYLSERHVIFCLFSDEVTLSVKTKIWQKLQSYNSHTSGGIIGEGLVQMPLLTDRTRLPDLVGPDSHALFSVLPQYKSLIEKHPKSWNNDEKFHELKTFLQNMPCVNDVAERVLGMVTDIHGKASAPKSAEQLDNLIKLTHAYRMKIRNFAKQTFQTKHIDTSTKAFLKNFKF